MANIFNIIKAQQKAGNNYVNKEGTFVNAERIQKFAKAAYLKAIKEGALDINTPFASFLADYTVKNYMSIYEYEQKMNYLIKGVEDATAAPAETPAE